MKFEDLIAKVHSCGRQTLAVAAAEDDAVLEAVAEAHKQGIADAILVGDEPAIRKIAAAGPPFAGAGRALRELPQNIGEYSSQIARNVN